MTSTYYFHRKKIISFLLFNLSFVGNITSVIVSTITLPKELFLSWSYWIYQKYLILLKHKLLLSIFTIFRSSVIPLINFRTLSPTFYNRSLEDCGNSRQMFHKNPSSALFISSVIDIIYQIKFVKLHWLVFKKYLQSWINLYTERIKLNTGLMCIHNVKERDDQPYPSTDCNVSFQII